MDTSCVLVYAIACADEPFIGVGSGEHGYFLVRVGEKFYILLAQLLTYAGLKSNTFKL